MVEKVRKTFSLSPDFSPALLQQRQCQRHLLFTPTSLTKVENNISFYGGQHQQFLMTPASLTKVENNISFHVGQHQHFLMTPTSLTKVENNISFHAKTCCKMYIF